VKSNSSIQADSALSRWMLEVSKEIGHAGDELANEAVHDLRVALRRCRSIADGLRAIDSDKSWKQMRRQATELFDNLGALRDCQVMLEWAERLGRHDDPGTQSLLARLRQQESGLKERAKSAIETFDRKQWEEWPSLLPRRAARLSVNSEAFQALALEKLIVARRLHARALKTNSDRDLHRLRIAVKKFRYLVENFLPKLHDDWKDGLKHAQDLLGEIHDLAVLRTTVTQVDVEIPPESREQWMRTLEHERMARIYQYKESMSGETSLWSKWRSGLPRGQGARHASLRRLQAWSSFLDCDVQHARRVARFAVQLYDGLEQIGLLNASRGDRDLLRAAAAVHEVGRAKGNKNHHKKTEKLVSQLRQLVGWSQRDVTTMARVARYYRGTLPQAAKLRDLPLAQRNKIKQLAGVLRLANAFDADHEGSIQRVTVAKTEGFVIIRALGLAADSSLAETIAAGRHLLEVTYNLPVLVQAAAKRGVRRRARSPNSGEP
jgi:CHAD domain-containing protein